MRNTETSNVALVTVDSLRADAIGTCDDERRVTERLGSIGDAHASALRSRGGNEAEPDVDDLGRRPEALGYR